jgi:hypothetical protein
MEAQADHSRLSTLVADLEQCAKQSDRRQPEALTLIRDVAVEIGRVPDLLQELERRANLVSSLCQPGSRYAAVKVEAMANLPSRTATTNPAILADLESLSRQAETDQQHPQFQIIGGAQSVRDSELRKRKSI